MTNTAYNDYILDLLQLCNNGDQNSIKIYENLTWSKMRPKIIFDEQFINQITLLAGHNSFATNLLGLMYNFGSGVAKDIKLALKYYTKAANNGLAIAMFNLGSIYYHGTETNRNCKLSLEWWIKGSSLNNARCMHGLGILYENGIEVDINLELAKQYYEQAAAGNHIAGLFQLALLYEHGKGVEQDYSRAFELYKKTVDLGEKDAIVHVGQMYEHGQGVKQNYKAAIYYYLMVGNESRIGAIIHPFIEAETDINAIRHVVCHPRLEFLRSLNPSIRSMKKIFTLQLSAVLRKTLQKHTILPLEIINLICYFFTL